MSTSFGVFNSQLAEAACNFLPRDKESSRLREKRRLERLQRRSKRRAEGIVIRPEPVAPGFCHGKPDLRDVRLRGYDALESIFPDASKEALICALLSAQHLPCSKRAAAASKKLLELGQVQMPLRSKHRRARSASPPCHENIHVAPSAPLLFRAMTQPVHDCPDDAMNLGLFGAHADSLMLTNVLDPLPSTKAPRASRPVDVACKSSGGEWNATQSGWRRSRTQDWQDEAIPRCSERQRKQKHFRSKYAWRSLRMHRRIHVDNRLLHAEPPALEILMAVEIAKTAAAALAQSDEMQGEEGSLQMDPWNSWPALQNEFWARHGQSLRKELGEAVQISSLYPNKGVQEEFLASCSAAGAMPLPAYHGTKSRNIMSISTRGLLIPGHGGVTVAHGSAHGVGIYTAKLGSSYLSKSFMDSDKLFICGVCDGPGSPDAKEKQILNRSRRPTKWPAPIFHKQHRVPQRGWQNPPKLLGNFRLHKDTGTVRHVGNAMVVFNEARVAPLFLASGVMNYPVNFGRSTRQGPCVVVLWPSGIPINPNHRPHSERVGRRQTLIPETQEVVWLPPEAETCLSQIRTKRRFESRRKKIRRRKDREEKVAAQTSY